jgi:hypothetical protein
MTRSDPTRDLFIDACRAEGMSASVGENCWDVLMEWLGRDRFPVELDDSLSFKLRMVGDDVDDTIVEIALRSGKQRPTTASMAGLEPVKKVRDMVTLVSRLPASASPATNNS